MFESVNTLFTFVMDNGVTVLTAISMIVAGASVLANFTPTQADNIFLDKISKAINALALNFKKPTQ